MIQIEPLAKQKEFLTSTAKFTCYSGGWGSGKTFAGCLRGLILSQQPGNIGLIGRLNYPELRDTTRKEFFNLCPPEYYDSKQGGRWSPAENHLTLTNGSEILFRHLDTMSSKELLSLNIGWFYIDQAEEITEDVFITLQSRLRLNKVPKRYGFITCNPEPGTWIYEKFQKPLEQGTLPADFKMINSSTQENFHLPPDYVKSLTDTLPEEMKKRYMAGRWDVMENQIYKEFDMGIHVIKPFTTPKSWEYLVGLDHGMVNPTCCLLATIDYDGNIFIIDEYYQPGIISQHAKAVHSMTQPYEISMWLIDPSTRAKTREKDGIEYSILQEYEDFGLYFTPANNELIAGINRVKEFLTPIKERRHPQTNEHPAPRLYIFQNCINLIEEIKSYQWKKMRSAARRNDPERPMMNRDHAVDVLRYVITSRFPSPLRNPTSLDMISKLDRANANELSSPMSINSGGDPLLGNFYGESAHSDIIG